MFSNRVLAAVVAVVLAAIGATLVFVYVSGAERRALEGVETVPVLVVHELVPAGTPANELEPWVQLRNLPVVSIAQGAVADVAALDDRVAAVDLLPGEQVIDARFVDPDGATTPLEGVQLLSIPVESSRAVGGAVAAGDRVGIFVAFDDGGVRLLLDAVLVTTVRGGASEGAEAAPELIVTLAVDAEQAREIVFAREYGSVWLTRQSENHDDPLPGELTREGLDQ